MSSHDALGESLKVEEEKERREHGPVVADVVRASLSSKARGSMPERMHQAQEDRLQEEVRPMWTGSIGLP